MSNIQRLEGLLGCFSGESRVLIIINADPDAIASAMAVKRLLWRKVSEVTITYFNEISRPDNIAMVRLLDAGLVPLAKINDRNFNAFVVVDSQPDHHECLAMFPYDAVIDHHPLSCDVGRFNDIREGYGACSTMMTEYLKAAGVKPSAKLATALLLGIKTDTSGFLRQAGMEDVKAFQYLYRFANIHLLTRIEQAELGEEHLETLAAAIRSRTILHNRIYAHAGKIANPDQCVITADFFMRISSVNWSIVSGVYNATLIIIIRNDGLRKNAGTAAKQAFEAVGSAGGHKSMARVEIPMAELDSGLDIGTWIIQQMEKHAGTKIV
ncbi:MAG: DHH family phosphoesterase [Desulfobacterium sp.]|nr:DHH family phosphoesterase [Desulfobacterium sp.]